MIIYIFLLYCSTIIVRYQFTVKMFTIEYVLKLLHTAIIYSIVIFFAKKSPEIEKNVKFR